MGWLWWRHRAGIIAAFGALYLALPAVALFLQALGVGDVGVTPAQWSSVAVTATLTGVMVLATLDAESPMVLALRVADRERRASELRGQAYALAALVIAEEAGSGH